MITAHGLTIFCSLLEGIAQEMGVALARSAFSPNIRERLDFSCALFTSTGELLAQAAHIPVHLGSMPALVQTVARQTPILKPGEVMAANDPFQGGTHLPDITLISPLYDRGRPRRLLGYAAARAHHADVGGMMAGSMPVSHEIFQEGLILPPVRLFRNYRPVPDLWAVLMRNVRTPEEREGDLLAQLAACHLAERRFAGLLERFDHQELQAHMAGLLDYTERLVRAELTALGSGRATHRDELEFEGRRLPLAVHLELDRGSVVCDFAGTAPALAGCLNAPLPVTCAAVYYCFQCLYGEGVPANQGAFRPIRVEAPPGCLVNARFPSAVVAGNVETSQRVVDTVFGALARLFPERIPAASAGTMNNLAIGGIDPRSGRPFAYYETMGGGCGAGPRGPGEDALQVHMTNTRNTPAESLELDYPLRLWAYQVRNDGGGEGRHRGGRGLVRELEFLAPSRVSLLAGRRLLEPPGAHGGGPGRAGRDTRISPEGASVLPGQFNLEFAAGDRLRIETPGGGGWGKQLQP